MAPNEATASGSSRAASCEPKKPMIKVMDACVRKSQPLSMLLLAVGIVGFLALPCFERRAKLDEKSLMVGGANPTLRSSRSRAVNLGRELMSMTASHFGKSDFADRLRSQLAALGLETYTSSFYAASVNCINGSSCSAASVNCTNLHAILRAPRGDGKESLLVVTPTRLGSGALYHQQDASAAALMLGGTAMLVAHLSTLEWQAKDLIWVVPDASCGALESLQQWALRYQTSSAPSASPFGRAGVMQQAVVVEVPHSSKFDTVEVLVEGFDGALPKLDMLQLLAQYTGVMRNRAQRVVVRSQRFIQTPGGHYMDKLSTMVRFMLTQARGSPTGPHAALKGLLVDAATARFIQTGAAGQVVSSERLRNSEAESVAFAMQLGEYLELILRSLNNLTERFHHSFFLYLLTSLGSFVTVEMYIIPVVALIAVLLLQAGAARRVIIDAEEEEEAGAVPAAGSCTAAFHAAQHRAAVGAWMSAVGIVAAACATCLVFGAQLPRLWGCSGHEAMAAASWLQPFQGLGGARVLYTAACIGVLIIAGPVLGLATANINQASRGGADGASAQKYRWKYMMRIRCVALSSAAACLAALACINWALAYIVVALLALASIASSLYTTLKAADSGGALLASSTSTILKAADNGPNQADAIEDAAATAAATGFVQPRGPCHAKHCSATYASLLLLFFTSPAMQSLLVCSMYSYLDPTDDAFQNARAVRSLTGDAQSLATVVSSIVCECRSTTWLVFWGISVPVWSLVAVECLSRRLWA